VGFVRRAVKTVNVNMRAVSHRAGRAGIVIAPVIAIAGAVLMMGIAIRVVSVLIANACINATTTSARTAIALPASVR